MNFDIVEPISQVHQYHVVPWPNHLLYQSQVLILELGGYNELVGKSYIHNQLEFVILFEDYSHL